MTFDSLHPRSYYIPMNDEPIQSPLTLQFAADTIARMCRDLAERDLNMPVGFNCEGFITTGSEVDLVIISQPTDLDAIDIEEWSDEAVEGLSSCLADDWLLTRMLQDEIQFASGRVFG